MRCTVPTAGSKRGKKMKKVRGLPAPLGVSRIGETTNYALAVPTGKTCELLLYRVGEADPFFRAELPEEEAVGEVRFLALDHACPWEYEYAYRIDGKEAEDPYAKLVCDPGKIRGKRYGYPLPYDWGEDRQPEILDADVVGYSLHVRGYTKHASSGVKEKGTFRGIIEKIPYFLELGINQIQCMPVYAFEERTGNRPNYWGYGDALFFAPQNRYAATKDAPTELKDMVRACHEAGIEVVLEMPFAQETDFWLAQQCLHYYVVEYHVDGFVLNPWHVSLECLRRDPLLKKTKFYQKDETFQNTIRRFLRGEEGMTGAVAQQMKHTTEEAGRFCFVAGHNGFTLTDVFSYDGKHNEANGEYNHDGPEYNYSWNCGEEGRTQKKAVQELRNRQIRNAMAFLFSAQGTPVLLAGDEFGNSQEGNNNVYCQDNETAWLDWGDLKKHQDLFAYVKAWIAFRKTHKILHQYKALSGMDKRASGLPDVSYHGEEAWREPTKIAGRLLGILYGETEEGGEVCYAAYNMHWEEHDIALPNPGKKRKWYLAADTEKGVLGTLKLLKDQRKLLLKPRTVQILIGRAE